MTTPSADPELQKRMSRLGIKEDDLEESFIRGTGAGGQKINKTSSTVQLKHLPSGIEVRSQRTRQQSANRYWARIELCERFEKLRDEATLAIKEAKEKKRRQTRPRPYGLQQKILRAKSQRGDTKKKRARVQGDD